MPGLFLLGVSIAHPHKSSVDVIRIGKGGISTGVAASDMKIRESRMLIDKGRSGKIETNRRKRSIHGISNLLAESFIGRVALTGDGTQLCG